jgi:environmental stress-induced protein Ves
MISIISPTAFKTIPWKNGQGETTELAINANATLDNFTWRISMASVVEDGLFSDFSGYQRNLILIEGNGINLQHDHNHIDKLTNILDIATFDGACSTVGSLHAGDITDFNIITDKEKYAVEVNTYWHKEEITLKSAGLCFIYSLSDGYTLKNSSNETTVISAGSLLQLHCVLPQQFNIIGEQLIVVYLTELT